MTPSRSTTVYVTRNQLHFRPTAPSSGQTESRTQVKPDNVIEKSLKGVLFSKYVREMFIHQANAILANAVGKRFTVEPTLKG